MDVQITRLPGQAARSVSHRCSDRSPTSRPNPSPDWCKRHPQHSRRAEVRYGLRERLVCQDNRSRRYHNLSERLRKVRVDEPYRGSGTAKKRTDPSVMAAEMMPIFGTTLLSLLICVQRDQPLPPSTSSKATTGRAYWIATSHRHPLEVNDRPSFEAQHQRTLHIGVVSRVEVFVAETGLVDTRAWRDGPDLETAFEAQLDASGLIRLSCAVERRDGQVEFKVSLYRRWKFRFKSIASPSFNADSLLDSTSDIGHHSKPETKPPASNRLACFWLEPPNFLVPNISMSIFSSFVPASLSSKPSSKFTLCPVRSTIYGLACLAKERFGRTSDQNDNEPCPPNLLGV